MASYDGFSYGNVNVSFAQVSARGGPVWEAAPVSVAAGYEWARGYGATLDEAAIDLLRLLQQIRLRLEVGQP